MGVRVEIRLQNAVREPLCLHGLHLHQTPERHHDSEGLPLSECAYIQILILCIVDARLPVKAPSPPFTNLHQSRRSAAAFREGGRAANTNLFPIRAHAGVASGAPLAHAGTRAGAELIGRAPARRGGGAAGAAIESELIGPHRRRAFLSPLSGLECAAARPHRDLQPASC